MTKAELNQARDRYDQRAWSEAHRSLLLADRSEPLGAEDLERLATAAYLIGRDVEFRRSLDRAYHAWVLGGEPSRAARCAFWLGLTLLIAGETGQANGWLARAQRLVEGRECVEQGYLLLPVAEVHLGEGNPGAALAAASAAAEIGHRFGDADLSTVAAHLQGRALMQQGQVQPAFRLLDEAMVAVTGGELSPIVTGLIYCSVIDACQQVFALRRAQEWTSALSRWCEQQPEMLAFTGTCLVHRAEIMQLRGAWVDAMAEACQACERTTRASGHKPPAGAFYRQGEINRLRGEYEAAEEAYRSASRLGAEPQPGLALLRLAQGQVDAAGAAIRRVLNTATDPLRRARLLPAYVEIALASGEMPESRAASAELDGIAERYATDLLRATAAHARGSVELADDVAQAALSSLRSAFDLWQRLEAVYETARVRLLIALACRALGDIEAAELEFDAARAIFEGLGAKPDLAALDSLRTPSTRARQHGLTARELDVLRHIAAGKTNKAIAAELSLSERTVDRHVSNILGRLGVGSRAAATAYAYSRKLL
jgi:DNA-binding CsgD family transcriptional regulator